MIMQTKKDNVEGGSPSPSASNNSKRNDEVKKSPETTKQEAINKSEKVNMNNNKGYNETPPDVPVKSTKKKAQ